MTWFRPTSRGLPRTLVLSTGVVLVAIMTFVTVATMSSDSHRSDESNPTLPATAPSDQTPTTAVHPTSEVPKVTIHVPEGDPSHVAIPPGEVAIATDGLLGVAFAATSADEAVRLILSRSGGALIEDVVEHAPDIGANTFAACHGPEAGGPESLRRVVIALGAADLRLYIADGVFMGYEARGSNRALRTAEGVGLGSSEADLHVAYGDRISFTVGLDDMDRAAQVAMGDGPPLRFSYRVGSAVDRVTVGARCAD